MFSFAFLEKFMCVIIDQWSFNVTCIYVSYMNHRLNAVKMVMCTVKDIWIGKTETFMRNI